jgi:hypothetical protein
VSEYAAVMSAEARSLRFQFGRCSVANFFPAALQVLRDNQEIFASFVENKIGFDEAEEVKSCYGISLTEVLQAL